MALLLKAAARTLNLEAKIGGGLFSVACRTKVRDYGFEEGHGEKNEVRKDAWFRKRNPPRKVHDWRRKQNLHPQALAWGPCSQSADWSYDESGDPGVLNSKQQSMLKDNLRLVEEVHQAAMLVKKAQEFEPNK